MRESLQIELASNYKISKFHPTFKAIYPLIKQKLGCIDLA